jgi:ERF superfamily
MSFVTSVEIKSLAEALAKAQGQFRKADKSAANPHFKNKYSPLEELIDATQSALAANGLSVTQMPSIRNEGVIITTMVLHASGEWLRSEISCPALRDTLLNPQRLGSVITYLTRYAYRSILRIACGDEDDDGESIRESAPPAHSEKRSRSTSTNPQAPRVPAAQSSSVGEEAVKYTGREIFDMSQTDMVTTVQKWVMQYIKDPQQAEIETRKLQGQTLADIAQIIRGWGAKSGT